MGGWSGPALTLVVISKGVSGTLLLVVAGAVAPATEARARVGVDVYSSVSRWVIVGPTWESNSKSMSVAMALVVVGLPFLLVVVVVLLLLVMLLLLLLLLLLVMLLSLLLLLLLLLLF